jgi:hypothetical protein
MDEQQKTDEIVGVTRCVRCGHQLENEIECPFCSTFEEPGGKNVLPKWIYFTACFLTSPFSIYFIIKSERLNILEKILAASGCSVWFVFYLVRL